MIGIEDPFVLTAYFGIIVMTVISLLYGLIRRNAALDLVTDEDRRWALDEQEVKDGL